jgi:gliding motility-associated-like protein
MTLGLGANPVHSYTNSGSFNVSMIATTASGCRDTINQVVNVYPVPTANFFSANVCLQNQMVFTDLSSVSGGGSFQHSWSFGDGNNASGVQVNNNYLQAGLYNVQLTVVTAQGCSASLAKPVQVYDLPLAAFSANDVCLNLPANFDDNSSIANGQITGWNWTLGDGSVSNMQHPIHSYGLSGIYPIILQVTSNYGCRNSASDSVSILSLPTPQPSALGGCLGENRIFSDLAPNVSPNDIQTWNWDFGNGLISAQSSPVVAFTTSGPQTVTLTTTNLAGCRATAQVSVMISPLPLAGFTNSNACDGSAVQFNNTSSIGQGASISGYNWNFGDGSLNSNLSNPSHVFAQAGTYTVTLVAISNEGCTDSIASSVTVHPLPVANFIHQNVAGCGPLIVAFTDSSYVASGTISTWFWNFGDGRSSTVQNPVHTYATTGNYAVSLTVTSNNGCVNTSTINNAVIVYPSPNALFTASPTVQSITNPVFDFINQSTGALTYNWLFGDGTSSPAENPQHIYADTGNYRVTLWVTNSYGCRDSISRPIRVEPIFTFYIPNAFTPNEDGTNDYFHVKGISIVDVKLSIFNRWGDQIYYKEGQQEAAAWDGSVVGETEEAKQDVYVYQVYVTDVWGKIHERVGHVSLVR